MVYPQLLFINVTSFYINRHAVSNLLTTYKQANVILKNINKVSFKEMTKEQLQAELI